MPFSEKLIFFDNLVYRFSKTINVNDEKIFVFGSSCYLKIFMLPTMDLLKKKKSALNLCPRRHFVF